MTVSKQLLLVVALLLLALTMLFDSPVGRAIDSGPLDNDDFSGRCVTVTHQERTITACGNNKQEKIQSAQQQIDALLQQGASQDAQPTLLPVPGSSVKSIPPGYDSSGATPSQTKTLPGNSPVQNAIRTINPFSGTLSGGVLSSTNQLGAQSNLGNQYIEMGPIGKNYYAMTVDGSIVEGDVRSLTRCAGFVTYPWLHTFPGIIDTFERIVGWDCRDVRVSHRASVSQWELPALDTYRSIQDGGGNIVHALMEFPNDISKYCKEGQGTSCRDPENSGPAKTSADAQRYFEHVASSFEAEGLGGERYIIWNEPNNADFSFKGGYVYNNGAWEYKEPTIEEYRDLFLAGARGLENVGVGNKIGGFGASSFSGRLKDAQGVEHYIPEYMIPILVQEGIDLDAYHYHYYNTEPKIQGDIEDSMDFIRAYYPNIKFSLDEYNWGIPPRSTDHELVAWIMALTRDRMEKDRYHGMGYFQIFTDYDTTNWRQDILLRHDNNLIDVSGVVKPAARLFELWKNAPGTLKLYDDLDPYAPVSTFTLTDGQGKGYCMYLSNFDDESATVDVTAINFPTGKQWRYTHKVIDATHGNPYLPDVQERMADLLDPILDEVAASGGDLKDYLAQAQPILDDINFNWPELQPGLVEDKLLGENMIADGVANVRIYLEDKSVHELCLSEAGTQESSGSGDLPPLLRVPAQILQGTSDIIREFARSVRDSLFPEKTEKSQPQQRQAFFPRYTQEVQRQVS